MSDTHLLEKLICTGEYEERMRNDDRLAFMGSNSAHSDSGRVSQPHRPVSRGDVRAAWAHLPLRPEWASCHLHGRAGGEPLCPALEPAEILPLHWLDEDLRGRGCLRERPSLDGWRGARRPPQDDEPCFRDHLYGPLPADHAAHHPRADRRLGGAG